MKKQFSQSRGTVFGSKNFAFDNLERSPEPTPVFESSPIEFDSNKIVNEAFHVDGLTDKESEVKCESLSSAKEIMLPVSTICLVLLTLMAISYSLYFCKPVMLPIVGAFLLNFLFSPVVARLHRIGVSNALAALLILAATLGAICVLILFAYDPAKDWLANRDENIVVVESKLMSLRKPLEQLRDVSAQIDKITTPQPKSNKKPENPKPNADQSPATPSAAKDVDADTMAEPIENSKLKNSQASAIEPLREKENLTNSPNDNGDSIGSANIDASPNPESEINETGSDVKVDDPENGNIVVAEPVPVEVRQPSISSRIFSTTGDVLIGFSLMIVLLFYLLASGDRGLEKLIALMPNWRQKRRTVELSRAIEKSISSYLLTTTLINAGLGAVIGTGMWLIGMPNPILWGVMAMLLNYFPFVGAIIGAAIVFVVAVVSFDSVPYAAAAPAIYLAANLIEANFITPVLLGRSVSLHPVWLMIFFVVVSWVWGLGGAIVAVPVLAVIKITCDHVEPLMPLGTFLGR